MSRKHIFHRSLLKNDKIYHSGVSFHAPQLPEQLIIRVGKACNFRCVFCNVAANEAILSMKPILKEILIQTFYRIKYSNFSTGVVNITVSGGEPSLFQVETLFVIKYFTRYFQDRNIKATFEMQSNASQISTEFATQLKRLGLYDVMVSYHTHDPEEYQRYIGVSYEKMGTQVNTGISNLLHAGVSVSFNVILSKINAKSFFTHIQFLMHKFPEVLVYNIGFVQPHGMAQENFSSLFIQYDEVYQTYNKVIGYLKFHNKKVHSHLVGLPLCYIDDYSSIMEYYHNKHIRKEGPLKHTLIQQINDNNKGYDKNCKKCKMKGLCSGVWKEYIGIQKIKPIPYLLFPLHKKNKDAYIYSPNLDLKGIKDSGADQIFVLIDETYNEYDISNILGRLRSLDFHLISLYFKTVPNITNFEVYYGVNFQIYCKGGKYNEFITALLAYNHQVSGQFKIKLDIFQSSQEKNIFSNYDDINIRQLYK